jgi:D-serine deaminase-like pyridoxal phosphate-dependent protein
MLFHQPFINEVARTLPGADVLLGKPMPVAAAANFYRQSQGGSFDPARQLRWLLDTPARVAQYDELARQLDQPMRACIELDVGLHRGGVNSDQDLVAMLRAMEASRHLSFSGFMGYEPHIVKVPGDTLGYRDEAMSRYRHYLELGKETLADAWPADALLNAGGSPTYQLYDQGDFPFNELAAGSCLVKPTDFDLPSLEDHVPASFIATPVLKSLDSVRIPGINLGPLQSLWNPNRAQAFFTYGGYWKARPESPRGLIYNGLYGRSTNQEMLNGSRSIELRADDWIFLRPTQSEFVFLQFGDIAVLEDGEISELWPVFPQGKV